MQRMNGLDASFYLLEDENTPLHVAAVIVMEGPAPSYGDLVRLVAAKLPGVERYRQRVRSVPLHAGRPVWVDDRHFQILYHVRHTAVPAPGGPDQLRNLAGRVLAQRLDPKKPLWELYLVEGLEGGGWALIGKVHHCMVDGVAGMDLIASLFELSPDAPEPEPEHEWRPRPEPSDLELLADTLVDNVLQPVRLARRLPGDLAGMVRRAPGVVDYAGGLARQLSRFTRASASVLNGPIGPHRRWCWADVALDDVRKVRKTHGGTVNDVVLAAVTAGFRAQLTGRGDLSPDVVVRSAVPVSTRTEEERGIPTNRVSAVFVNLPVGQPDPVARLLHIRTQMDDLKSTRQERGAAQLTKITDTAVAPALLVLGARTPIRLFNPIVQTVTTNVPGPAFPLYILGRRMVAMYPCVPLAGGIQLATAIFSYLGRLYFGVSADFDGQPDATVFASGIEAGVAELLRS
ncbi:wax ester/triacylglycerol synthase family O-acyltransferase [Actinocorallia sp. API 0066]|uniref:WS/DGAT/MGAT family O-acyltransferase n=1 Tax=Actinocorallia sp. API 0066 TaxID=2896846 RepID=UPI001E325493|nr:wax ester/triacylglycerol synthase family O-acyltransferase [Actinocorallia sp. API 0066]MCD0451084.1 wax ester/triacylglycerol synthase family O-acyltransferase [Actinocorallia sp. API 0066]